MFFTCTSQHSAVMTPRAGGMKVSRSTLSREVRRRQ